MSALESAPDKPAARVHRGGPDLIDEHSTDWANLCERSVNDSPFVRPEWIAAYVRAFEPRSNVVLVTARGSKGLLAILPLIEKKKHFCGLRVRMLQGAANIHSCRFDLLRSAGEEGELAVQAIWDALKSGGDWEMIELPYVPEHGVAEQFLQEARKDGFLTGHYESYASPYVVLPESGVFEDVPLSVHFRSNLRRRLKKAREEWSIRLQRIEEADSTHLDRFFTLEASGWKGRKKTAIASADPTRAFYEGIARVGALGKYFSLYMLEFGDSTVSGHFGLSYKGRYYSPKVAYDETYGKYGPGHLIIDAILRDLLEKRFVEYDFLGPWMPWKAEWTSRHRRHSFCYVFRPNVLGRSLYAARVKAGGALRQVEVLRRIVGAESLPTPPETENS